MFVCDVGEHILVVGVTGEGIDAGFEVEEMAEKEGVVGSAWLCKMLSLRF